MLKQTMVACAVSLVITAGSLLPQSALADPAEEAIKYRQSVFTAMRWHFAAMGAMIRGKVDYDAEQFKHHSTQVAALAHMPREGFIEGSDFGDTNAKAELWENLDDVDQRFASLVETTQALNAAAGGELSDVKGLFGDVAKTCKGCHDNYKEED